MRCVWLGEFLQVSVHLLLHLLGWVGDMYRFRA